MIVFNAVNQQETLGYFRFIHANDFLRARMLASLVGSVGRFYCPGALQFGALQFDRFAIASSGLETRVENSLCLEGPGRPLIVH